MVFLIPALPREDGSLGEQQPAFRVCFGHKLVLALVRLFSTNRARSSPR